MGEWLDPKHVMRDLTALEVAQDVMMIAQELSMDGCVKKVTLTLRQFAMRSVATKEYRQTKTVKMTTLKMVMGVTHSVALNRAGAMFSHKTMVMI